MKNVLFAVSLGLSMVAASAAVARGPIETGCNKSDRRAASRSLCACIQKVADATLSSSHQRRGAAFFADPHKSQDVRTSDSRSDERFWEEWKAFGAAAEQYCR